MGLLRLAAAAACFLPFPTLQGGDARTPGIAFLEERVRQDRDDFIAWNQLATRYHEQLRRTGDGRFLDLERQAAEQSCKAVPAEQNPGGLAALAQALLAAHRFKEARDAAEKLRGIQPGKIRALELLADAQIELGEYEAALKTCAALVEREGAGLSALPRQARLDLVHGRLDQARERLADGVAQAMKISPPAPDLVAWFQLQLGELAFQRGEWPKAQEHYRAAEKAWPDWPATTDHLAELHAARGELSEAIRLYESLAGRLPRPEYFQALGDLYALAGKSEQSVTALARAEESYLRVTRQGAVHFFHHLAGFFADSKPNPAQAVEWARKDLALRPSIFAWDALAWALYKNGQTAEAVEAAAKALATGVRDPHMYYHAGLIRLAAGDIPGGRAALQDAANVNPRFNTFHVHR